ncbi:hypothetical protein BpHYR1_050256 [Brachionus plicatilis]|uniref:Uncharacterized protein n=1 Tax=Brachionus plicatilis TaxID=10195 RepID=A0A3M7RW12_BRAPC|nr:hypothetical protein BpHYR1_050256 [Brachionus plicatilis]
MGSNEFDMWQLIKVFIGLEVATEELREVVSEKSDNEEKEERQEELADETKPVGPVAFDQDALVKLCGSQGKRKGVDSIELFDVG